MLKRVKFGARNSNCRRRFYLLTLAISIAACAALVPESVLAGEKAAPRQRMGGGRGGFGGRFDGPRGGGFDGGTRGARGDSIRQLFRQADTLRVEQSDIQIVMSEPGRATDVFYPDGKEHERDACGDITVTDRAAWKGGALRIERRFGRGGRITESYETSPDVLTLTVTARMEFRRGGDTIEVKSVYEKER